MTQEWVSSRAVAWVIHDAPVPADLAFTLTVIAARCDEHGRGSYQSVPTIAEKTGKSVDQVERDIKRLRALGLLLLGDQRRAEHLPKGKRPVVYDLPLSVKGPKPLRRSKNPTGKTSDGPTPRIHAGGGTDATPRMDAPSTPRIHAVPTPRMDAGEIKPLNNPLNNPSLSAAEQAIADATDATPEESREMIDLIIQEWSVRAPDSYIPQMKPADLGAYLTRVQARHVTTPTPPQVAAVLAQHRAPAAPRPRGAEQPPSADQSIAELRARIGSRRTEQPERSRPLTTPPKAGDPAVQAAYDRLSQCGDYDRWWTAARQQLGTDAHRNEVVLLADQLAKARLTPAQEAS